MIKRHSIKRHILVAFLLLFALPYLLCLSVQADTEEKENDTALPEEYESYLDGIPDEIKDLLPEGFFSNDAETVGDTVSQMSDFSYLLRTVLELVGINLSDFVKTVAQIVGILILSAIIRSVKISFRSDSIAKAFSFCTTLVITLCLISKSYLGISSVTAYFESLSKITSATLPLMGALYAMGGNVAAAVASTAGLATFLTVLEQLIAKSILPFCGICMASALISGLDPSLRTGTLASTVKKSYTTALSFLMMLLIAMLATQTTLGARQDSLAMKSIKFAAGNWIPVVGGSVGDLFKTVSTSVGYIRGTIGLSGILLLLLTLLPTLVKLFLARAAWQLSASVADLLGCDTEKKLLEEFASLIGYLIAAVSITSSVLLLSFALVTHCVSALG